MHLNLDENELNLDLFIYNEIQRIDISSKSSFKISKLKTFLEKFNIKFKKELDANKNIYYLAKKDNIELALYSL